jgi:hypothetical protein
MNKKVITIVSPTYNEEKNAKSIDEKLPHGNYIFLGIILDKRPNIIVICINRRNICVCRNLIHSKIIK